MISDVCGMSLTVMMKNSSILIHFLYFCHKTHKTTPQSQFPHIYTEIKKGDNLEISFTSWQRHSLAFFLSHLIRKEEEEKIHLATLTRSTWRSFKWVHILKTIFFLLFFSFCSPFNVNTHKMQKTNNFFGGNICLSLKDIENDCILMFFGYSNIVLCT